MAYGTANVDNIQSSTAGTPVVFKDGGGTQIGTLCRAWVNFNGTTSPGTIRAAFNVSSVTKSGTGSYVVNLTTAMPDTNYCVTVSTTTNASGGLNCWYSDTTTTSTISVGTYGVAGGGAGAYRDTAQISVAIFR